MNIYYAITVARASLPRLTIARRVIDKMVANAMVYATETGESLVGFAIKPMGRQEPDLYVIDTIPPDESAIRRGAYFEQGDDLQGDIFNWWFDNWQMYRERRRSSYGNAVGAKWDVPLIHLGDWHKHPGTLVEPSWGDSDTAREHIFDEAAGTPQILAILATVWDRASAFADEVASDMTALDEIGEPRPIKVLVNETTVVRLDCWYMSRYTRRFVRLSPTIVEDGLLPSLPVIGWPLRDPARMRSEIQALRTAGFAVSVEQFDADKQPPLEVCLSLARRTSQDVLIVVTQADYPAHRPTVRTAPMSVMRGVEKSADLFPALWNASQPLPETLYPAWTPEQTIASFVQAIESRRKEGSTVP